MNMWKLMQSLKFLSLINVHIPVIVTSFTQNLDIASRNIISLFLDTNEDQYGCDLPLKVELINLSCIGLNNTSIELSLILFLLIFKLMISLIALIMKWKNESKNKVKIVNDNENKGYFQNLIEKMNDIFALSLIILLANQLNFKLLIGNWVSLYSLHKIGIYSIISLLMLPLLLIYNLGFLILAIYTLSLENVSENRKKKISKQNIFTMTLDALCTFSKTQNISYSIFMTIKDISMSFTLIFGQNLPLLQLIISLFFFTLQISLIIYLKPQKNLKSNILELINTSFQLLIIIFFGLIYFSEYKMTPKNISTYYGLPILILLVSLFLINSLVEVFFSIKYIIERCLALYKNCSKKPKKKNSKNKKNRIINARNPNYNLNKRSGPFSLDNFQRMPYNNNLRNKIAYRKKFNIENIKMKIKQNRGYMTMMKKKILVNRNRCVLNGKIIASDF